MMTRLKKQDWVDLRTSAETNLKTLEVQTYQYENLLSIANGKILEFDAQKEKDMKEAEAELNKVVETAPA